MATATRLLVDVHTHVYLPRYASLMRSRTTVPRIIPWTGKKGRPEERLLILDHEPSGGRPIGTQYWDRNEKIKFMDQHGIDVSVVSTANPWLDFLPPVQAHQMAHELNDDLEDTVLEAIKQISHAPHLKGLIMGTKGIGKGLDDDALDPVWADNGHVLPLALGFPFETTVAATRLILSGVFDRFPNLRLLLAHSGGALPQLSSRLASCIDHDPLYLDAVSYGPEEMGFTADVISRASRYAVGGSLKAPADRATGSKQMLFGTDHPFFPPLSSVQKWKSVEENLEAIDAVHGWDTSEKVGVRGGNALSLFSLP
ncbi:hypothetical protein CPB85DRAFT_1283638 [Mucidula mucida]|nr:hypothetical protein CPB85DRAFT_1283638 [Mucidula mucida]